MKTRAQAQELEIIRFPYYEYDKNGFLTYEEYSNGFYLKYKHDDKGNTTYRESSCKDRQYYIR